MNTSNDPDPVHSDTQPAAYEDQVERIVKRPLSEAEARERAEIEQRIRDRESRSLRDSLATGRDLLRIRSRSLYADQYDDFLTYCQVKLDLSKQRVHQLILAVQVFDALSEKSQPRLTGERQLRALHRVNTFDRDKVLESIEGKVTAKAIEETAELVRPTIEALVLPKLGTKAGDYLAKLEEEIAKVEEGRKVSAAYAKPFRDAHRDALKVEVLIRHCWKTILIARSHGRWLDFDTPNRKISAQLRQLAEEIDNPSED